MRFYVVVFLIFVVFAGQVVIAADYSTIMGQKEITFEYIGDVSKDFSWEKNPDILAYYARQKGTIEVFYHLRDWVKSLSFMDRKLGDLLSTDQELKEIVQQNIFKDFHTEELIYPDGRVKVTLIRRWNGTDLALVLDRLYRKLTFDPGRDETLIFPEDDVMEAKNLPDEYQGYTGVIIDTRGYHVKPSMAPKIFDTKKEEVYGTMDADISFVIEVGIIGYAYNLEEALKDSRVGSKPYIVKAVGRSGNAKDHAIIPLDKANFIREMDVNSSILNECRVMFIIDE